MVSVATESATQWRAGYDRLAAALPILAPRAAPVLAGFSACVDAIHHLNGAGLDALAAAAEAADPHVRALSAVLLERIRAGRGGEIHYYWNGAPAWLADLLGPPLLQLGGSGPQAGWALAAVGAPVLMALADRSPEQLGVLHPGTSVALGGQLIDTAQCTPDSGSTTKPHHPILEFTAGTVWSGGVLTRSSRIIISVHDDGIEHDEDFASLSAQLAPGAGAGLLSGTNGIPDGDDALAWMAEVGTSWRDAGLAQVHLELAEFSVPNQALAVCAQLRGAMSEIGMSNSELQAIYPGRDPMSAARQMAQDFEVARVVVHADEWSAMVHHGSAAQASTALACGNLLAAARADRGVPSPTPAFPSAAEFSLQPGPRPGELDGDWRVDVVPSPWLRRPISTIGLGDTFTAGLLLAAAAPQLQQVLFTD